jgi:hypothetical protein
LIDFAPINYRIMPGFINQQWGFTGMLYSQVAGWSSDPWNNVQSWQAAGYTFPGDGVLVYPGQQVGLSSVVPSLRLKMIRDGFDDYDYLAMLRDQGQTTFVNQVLSSVVPDWHNWTKDPAALESARVQLGQQLDRLGGGARPPSCDVNADGAINIADVQMAINQLLGIVPCATADLQQNGHCDVIDVQRVIIAALGGTCRIGP